jgi:hypothetical protein
MHLMADRAAERARLDDRRQLEILGAMTGGMMILGM